MAGERRLSKLFTKAQRAFYAEHAPEGLGLDDLAVLGPIFVLKLRLAPKAFDRRLVAEMWLYPTTRGSSSSRPSARPPRRSRSLPRRGVPRRAGRRPRRRAGDEDAQGARVFSEQLKAATAG